VEPEFKEPNGFDKEIPITDLCLGEVYFTVAFADRELCIPILTPVVFAGHDLIPGESGYYFQDAVSYLEGKRWDDSDRSGIILHVMSETDVSVMTYEDAVDALHRCGRRRRPG
jgi:hypothetical protein